MVNNVLLIVSSVDLMLMMWLASRGHDRRANMASKMSAIRSASVIIQGGFDKMIIAAAALHVQVVNNYCSSLQLLGLKKHNYLVHLYWWGVRSQRLHRTNVHKARINPSVHENILILMHVIELT